MNAIHPIQNTLQRKPFFLLILLFLTVSQVAMCQYQPTPVKKTTNRVTVTGKKFYLHEVLRGQTLYGISKAYQVSEDEIVTQNPDLKKRSVYPGMLLRIPDPGATGNSAPDKAAPDKQVTARLETKIENAKPEPGYIEHSVQPKENLFSISRLYGVKVDEIRELNPDAIKGLKTGQIIRIPKGKNTIEQKAAVPAAVPVKTAATTAVTEPANIRDDQPCKVKPFPHITDEFRMALLLPLNISQNDTLIYSDTLQPEHFRFYEFLEGVYTAIDSLQAGGMNLTVEVFDTERNPETIKKLLDSGKLKDADLIIGPVFSNEMEQVTEYSRSNRIPMVSPFSTYDVVRNNPVAFQVRNKQPKQIELETGYLGSKYAQNVLVIGRLSEKRNPDFTRFTANLGAQLREHDPAKKAGFKTIYYSESARSFETADSVKTQLTTYLSGTTPNYIILSSENEVFTTEVINELYQVSSTRNIRVFGLYQWVFSDLDLGNLYSVNLELPSDFQDDNPFVDYTDPGVLAFCRKYEENWNIQPSKYSFQGFDIAFRFTNALYQFGHNLAGSVPCWSEYLNQPTMITPMKFVSSGSSNGFTNQAITIIRYQKDELVRKKVN